MVDNILKERISSIAGHRVLVAPLSWGLGHATRCVSIVRLLLNAGKQVVIASDGYPLEFLKQEFKETVEFVDFPWCRVKYSSGKTQIFSMLSQLPKFIYSISREHRQLPKIIKQYDIDTVISDNRFGLWTKDIPSIYITHQISVKITRRDSTLNYIAYRFHRLFIERYSECWIPDFKGEYNLSGDLSHRYPLPKNAYFIGALSRFQNIN